MRRPATLITGANGEIGHGLVADLSRDGASIVSVDLTPLDPALARFVSRETVGSILDRNLLERLLAEFEIDRIFHLGRVLHRRLVWIERGILLRQTAQL